MNITHGRLAGVAAASVFLLTGAQCGPGPAPERFLSGTVNIAGKEDQPGFNLETNYKRSGFEVELARYLGDAMGFSPQWINVPSKEREQAVKSGRSKLVIATYSITEERLGHLDMVGPYLITPQGFLVRKDYSGISERDDVDGSKEICTVEGSTAEAVKLPRGAVFYTEPDYSTCVDDVRNREADAVFTDLVLLHGYAERYSDVKVLGDVTFGRPNRYGIGIAKGHRKECEELRKALREFINEKWSTHFGDKFPKILDEYSGTWENQFKPDPAELDQYSTCTDGTPRETSPSAR
jgi:glutamate transport system substrate-binding protein